MIEEDFRPVETTGIRGKEDILIKKMNPPEIFLLRIS